MLNILYLCSMYKVKCLLLCIQAFIQRAYLALTMNELFGMRAQSCPPEPTCTMHLHFTIYMKWSSFVLPLDSIQPTLCVATSGLLEGPLELVQHKSYYVLTLRLVIWCCGRWWIWEFALQCEVGRRCLQTLGKSFMQTLGKFFMHCICSMPLIDVQLLNGLPVINGERNMIVQYLSCIGHLCSELTNNTILANEEW